ncbi:ATP-dependent helicase HrpB [Sesbania bispinosa]|nr:ATP-dependent helicase HrpB [Sesbania bispinosa]
MSGEDNLLVLVIGEDDATEDRAVDGGSLLLSLFYGRSVHKKGETGRFATSGEFEPVC